MARKKDDFVNNIAKEINEYSLDEIMEEGFGRYSKEIIQDAIFTPEDFVNKYNFEEEFDMQ